MDDLVVYRVEEVAGILKVSPRSVHRLIQSGQLEAVRVGRFLRVTADALHAFLGSNQSDRRAREP